MGFGDLLPDGHAIDSTDGTDVSQSRSPIDRYYAGMLSCGLDASINDRANHSHLAEWLAAVFRRGHRGADTHEKLRIPHQGRWPTVRWRSDIISPLLTVATPPYRRRHRGVPVFTVRGRTV